jgi:hypothetical protein
MLKTPMGQFWDSWEKTMTTTDKKVTSTVDRWKSKPEFQEKFSEEYQAMLKSELILSIEGEDQESSDRIRILLANQSKN